MAATTPAHAILRDRSAEVQGMTNRWTDIWKVYVYGYDQFWFLQALFPVFLTVVVLDGLEMMATELTWLACVAAAGLASRFLPKTVAAADGRLITCLSIKTEFRP